MTRQLFRLALVVALGSSFALAQNMPRQHDPSAAPQAQQAPAATGDVQGDIQSAIQKDPSLASSNINVQVTSTSVVLTGTAPSQAAKDAAEQIAKSKSGGLPVKNNIKVGGGGDNPK